MSLFSNSFVFGFCINFVLIFLFHRVPLMTKEGWISAGVLGSILWGCLSWQGWISVVIYLLFGSIVTKIGYKFKKNEGIAEKRGGRRGPENVWGSAATGLFFAIMIKLNFANLLFYKIGFFIKNKIPFVKLSETILRTSTATVNATSILNQWRNYFKLIKNL